jgi:tripartite-type tricarboxylate transporter receptor subunit TctC
MNAVSPLRRALICTTALSAVMLAGPALSQDKWPTKTVRLLAGFPPGGVTDIMARLVAHGLSEGLGRTVIVENRPGASGNIAAGEVVRAAPDGYTFLVAPNMVETANPLLFKAPFNPVKDLTSMVSIGRMQLHLVVRPGLGVKNAKELMGMIKARAGKLSYASPGVGTQGHLAGELFVRQSGGSATHVPQRGDALALADVAAGHMDFMFVTGLALPHIRAGKLTLLGVAGTQRSPFFPDAPTMAEQGVGGMELLDVWWGLWAPNGTPPAIIARINELLAKVLAHADLKLRFAEIGAEPVLLSAPAFRKLLHDEARVMSALIRDFDVKVE